MSDTPETDAAVKESNGQWSFVLKETCQRLERERDEAIRQRDETNTSSKYACDYNYEQKLKAERERDEARELRDGDNRLIEALAEDVGIKISCNPKLLGVVWEQFHDGVFELKRERDEAREKAERYRLEANAMMLQRDELKKIVEQRILVGAGIHDRANSLIKQNDKTEAECERLRKQLTAATSALRQIHLEVGDWIRSTVIVKE